MSDRIRVNLIRALPTNFQALIKYHFKWYLSSQNKIKADADEFEFYSLVVNSPKGLESSVSRAINSIVWQPAITQSLKGILTAGLGGSVKYAAEKLVKGLRARR
jgi:mitochondrial translocator assembly and maintenance protein 41